MTGRAARRQELAALALLLTGLAAPLFLAGRTNNPPTGNAPRVPAAFAPEPDPGEAVGDLPDGAVARLGNSRGRHDGRVWCAAFAPDGRTVFSGGEDGVRVWDAPTGRLLRRLGGPEDGGSVAVSPDGRLLATGGSDWKARVWMLATGRPVLEADQEAPAPVVAFSPDGRRVYVSGCFTVAAWDLRTDRRVRTYGRNPPWAADNEETPILPLRNLAVSPDGSRVAADYQGGDVRVWDAATGAESLPAVPDGRLAGPVAFSPDSAALVCVRWSETDRGILLWDLAAGRERSRVALADDLRCNSLAFAPDGRSVAGACPDGVRVWSVPDWRELAVLRGHAGVVNTVAFSPDGKYLLTASSDTTLLVWDTGGWAGR